MEISNYLEIRKNLKYQGCVEHHLLLGKTRNEIGGFHIEGVPVLPLLP